MTCHGYVVHFACMGQIFGSALAGKSSYLLVSCIPVPVCDQGVILDSIISECCLTSCYAADRGTHMPVAK